MLRAIYEESLTWLDGSKEATNADFEALFARLPARLHGSYEEIRDVGSSDFSGPQKRIWAIGEACRKAL